VIAIVRVGVIYRNEGRPKRSLPTFWDEYLLGFRKIRSKTADEGELKTAAPSARFPVRYVAFDLVRDGGERLLLAEMAGMVNCI
jgi:hypothetical protein